MRSRGLVGTAILLSLSASSFGIAWAQAGPQPKAAPSPGTPTISITSPADGTPVAGPVVDVAVTFAAGEGKGSPHVTLVELRRSGVLVGSFSPSGQARSGGSHTFAGVDLSPFIGSADPAVLVARAYQGNFRKENFRDSAPVRVTVTTAPDGTPPGITILTPANGSVTRNALPTITGRVSDAGGSGVDVASVTVKLDGQGVSAVKTVVDANTVDFSFTPIGPISDGPHGVAVDAGDLAGNAASTAAVSFAVDTVAPLIASPQPANGTSTTTTPAISASWSDPAPGSGVDPASAVVRLDNVVVGVSVNGGGFSFTPSPLSAGPHTVTAQVNDVAGNTGSLTWSFTVVASPTDTVPPVISNLLPASGSFTNAKRPPLSAQVTDSGGSGLDAGGILMTLNGVAVPALVTLQNANSGSVTFAPTFDLGEGQNAFSVTAGDNAGNGASPASSAFTVDTVSPSIVISSPLPGQTFPTTDVTIGASASDALTGVPAAQVVVLLNGLDRTSDLTVTPGPPNSFGFPGSVVISGPLTSPTGTNILSVSATDPAGNVGSAQVIYEVTATPPPPTDQIVLTKMAGDGQTVVAGEATGPLVVRATFLSSGNPVSNLTLTYSTGSIGDRFSAINAIGPVTDSAGNAEVRFVPGQAGAGTVTVGVLEDDSVAPVTFSVNAQAVSLGNVTTVGPCNLSPGTSEFPGSALPMLLKWKALKPNGSPLSGARMVARVTAFGGVSPPPFKVGDFLPSVGVTNGSGEATFAFVISHTASPGSFTMEFSLPDYPDGNGIPVAQTLGGTVRPDADKPRNFGDTEIVWDDPDQSGQGQIGIPGKNVFVPLRARFFGASSGGGITFRIIEGDGSFEAGTEGDFVGDMSDQTCAKITGNIRATVSEGSDRCRGNIRFKLAAGYTHALIAMDSFTDIFAVGPPEVHVEGSGSDGVIKDAVLPADFRNLSGAPQFKIQMYAPRDLDSPPTFSVTSQTTSLEPLPAFSNDVAPTTLNNLSTSLASTNGRYGVWETTQPIMFLPDRALLGDMVPTLGGVAFIQGSDFGGLKLVAQGAAVGETRVAVARGIATAGSPGQSELFYKPGIGGNQRDSAVLVVGTRGAPGIDKIEYKFDDGVTVNQTGANIGVKVNHTFTLNKSARETRTCAITIHYNTGVQGKLEAKMRISNPVVPFDPPDKGQQDLNTTYQWNVGETATAPPTAFANLAQNPFAQAIPPLVSTRMTQAGLPIPKIDLRLIYKAVLPGDQKAGGTSQVFELTLFDFRNYQVFGSYVGERSYGWTRAEQVAIVKHHEKHVVDLFDAQGPSAGSSGQLIRQVYEQYKVNQNVQGSNTVNPPTAVSWDALGKCFDAGPGNKRGPHAFLELEPMATQGLDPAVANSLLDPTMRQLTVWFNSVTREFPDEPGILTAHKKHVVDQYKRLLVVYPELKHSKEFSSAFKIDPPEF